MQVTFDGEQQSVSNNFSVWQTKILNCGDTNAPQYYVTRIMPALLIRAIVRLTALKL
jgi:hypothetical protein